MFSYIISNEWALYNNRAGNFSMFRCSSSVFCRDPAKSFNIKDHFKRQLICFKKLKMKLKSLNRMGKSVSKWPYLSDVISEQSFQSKNLRSLPDCDEM